jgi:hypothetical protein
MSDVPRREPLAETLAALGGALSAADLNRLLATFDEQPAG